MIFTAQEMDVPRHLGLGRAGDRGFKDRTRLPALRSPPNESTLKIESRSNYCTLRTCTYVPNEVFIILHVMAPSVIESALRVLLKFDIIALMHLRFHVTEGKVSNGDNGTQLTALNQPPRP